jgi:hypothetical protein
MLFLILFTHLCKLFVGKIWFAHRYHDVHAIFCCFIALGVGEERILREKGVGAGAALSDWDLTENIFRSEMNLNLPNSIYSWFFPELSSKALRPSGRYSNVLLALLSWLALHLLNLLRYPFPL